MARDQQFCLRWNNYQNNLTQVFEQLLHSEIFVDVTLACDNNSIKAHRMVLSACSPYFQTVLSETPCSHPVVILQGVKWQELKSIVEFMYKGEINVAQDQLASLLHVADSLKIRGLADVGGEEAEAVLTSPSASPRGTSFWGDSPPRKKRRSSTGGEDRSRSRSRSPVSSPAARNQSPQSRGHGGNTPGSGTAAEILETCVDIPSSMSSRGSSAASSVPPSNMHSPSPVASLASSLSSLAHLHGPMPPPGPHLPPHLAHLPPLSPLSPLLNMHPMPRHHSPEDFEIRPGIAEMIREEERAKLLESTHHWISNPMADSYQAQVQAAWQKSWNQTQSLLQNLRFRERGPLKSWRPETMAEAIHAVLKEGLSLSQAARKYDIPYPTFVLYANRVHNLLGPSHEPGDMRPKGRGRPQRILLGSWPEDQIKGVIRAVVFRDTTVFRDGDHKNKQPAPPTAPLKEGNIPIPNGSFTPNSNRTSSSTPEGNTPTPLPPSTPSTSQALASGPASIPPSPTVSDTIPLPPHPKQEPKSEPPSSPFVPSANSPSSDASSGVPTATTPTSNVVSVANTSPSGGSTGPLTPQSRPSSTSSNSQQQNGPTPPHHNNSSAKMNGPSVLPVAPVLSSPTNGSSANLNLPLSQLPPNLLKGQSLGQNSLLNHQSQPHSNAQLRHQQQQRGLPATLFPQQSNQTARPSGPSGLPGLPGQQMLGLIGGGLPPSLPNSHAHMARLFNEGPPLPLRPPHAQPPINAFHPGYPGGAHPAMQAPGMLNPAIPSSRINNDDSELTPEAVLFGKLASSSERFPFSNENGSRQNAQFDGSANSSSTSDRSLLFRDGLDTIKSEPEAIMN